jgi:glycosyltransferase involved in cell wall biosynthesis
MPTVSVIIPSYNHEAYIAECLESVLNQTYQDFEVVFTDDGSTDRTVEIIKRFDDARITLFRHAENKGACVAANNCLQHAGGKYVAMLSSDDAWHPEKLEVQVRYLNEHPEHAAVFSRVDWVDESGRLIPERRFRYGDVFNVANRTRFEWLGYFFENGNCLCHPSSLVRRECYAQVGAFNPALAGLPDLDLWIRICLKYEIMILDQKLIRFRRIGDQSNASGESLSTGIRNRFEYSQLLNHYLQIRKPEELLLTFPAAANYGEVTEELVPYFLGRIAIDTGLDFKMLWGLSQIYALIQDEKTARTLEEKCKFSYRDFMKLARESDAFGLSLRSRPLGALLSAVKRFVKELYVLGLEARRK